ncbi:hypothetical protein P3535_23210, partial [Vibrio parahaemolyticus]|nr:hypothetical protein [Vibrio parahaemolyticus]
PDIMLFYITPKTASGKKLRRVSCRKPELKKGNSAELWLSHRPTSLTGLFLRGHHTKAGQLSGLNIGCLMRS